MARHPTLDDHLCFSLYATSMAIGRVYKPVLDEFGITFPTALDSEGRVREFYGVVGLPATFFIDPDGILRARNFGPVYGNLLQDGIEAAR